MRFMERAIKALGYHRRPYAAGAIGTVLFILLCVTIQTARQLNLTTKLNFQNRLAQFDTSAVRSADHLIVVVKQTYHAVGAEYQQAWWLVVGGFITITAVFTIIGAITRRKETAAYLLVGKSPADIVAQYVLENVIVYVCGFAVAGVLVVCFGGMLTKQLTGLNQHLFDQRLANTVSDHAYQSLIKQLFDHRLTDFSAPGLMFPHPVGLHPVNANVSGLPMSFITGLISLIITQDVIFGSAVWHQRRQLRHHA